LALYILSDILYRVLYYVIKYRRKVVQENSKNSFPQKSLEERNAILKSLH